MNLGRDKLYNAKVRLEATGLSPSGTVFLGNIEAGTAAEGSMKIYVKEKRMKPQPPYPQAKSPAVSSLTYEDSSGNS